MKRPYEMVVIFDGSLPEDALAKEQEQVEAIIKENAEFEKAVPWGKRTLAYQIKKKKTGHYVLFEFVADGNLPAVIDKHFKLSVPVLRYLIVIKDLNAKKIEHVASEEDERGDRREGRRDRESGERRERGPRRERFESSEKRSASKETADEESSKKEEGE